MIPDEIGKRLGPETRKSDAWSDWLRRRSKLNLVFCSGFLVKKCETTQKQQQQFSFQKEIQLSYPTARDNLCFKLTNPARIYSTRKTIYCFIHFALFVIIIFLSCSLPSSSSF